MANSGQRMKIGGDHSMGWFGRVGLIFKWIFWDLSILFTLYLIKWIMTSKTVSANAVLEILKVPYSKGKIDKLEFKDKNQDLS
jgi:uncharacterized membrane protein